MSSSVPPFSIVYTSPLTGFSFDRLFVTWPYLVFSSLTTNLALTIRLFLYYTFLLYSTLCFTVAYLAADLYSRRINPLNGFQKNAGMIAIYILAYSNLSALNLNADGGTWSDGLILLFIVISILLIIRNEGTLRTYLPIGGLMILSFLMDPDYTPMFWTAVLGTSLIEAYSHRSVRSIAFAFIAIFLSSLSIGYLYLQADLSSQLAVSGFNVLGYRDFSPSTVSYFANNITPFNVLLQFGHIWSTIVYAPPSILLYGNVPFQPTIYSPPQVLVVGGVVFYLWIFALIAVPLISFSSLLYSSTRKFALPILLPFIIAYLITQEWNFRFIYASLHYLSYIPIFGSAIGTSLSLPGHFINFLVFLYIPLFSLGAFQLIYYADKVEVRRGTPRNQATHTVRVRRGVLPKRDNRPDGKTLLAAGIVIALLILGGWQAFNGSFYPMRASQGSFLLGNSIEPKGVFAPTAVNSSVIQAYNLVISNYSEGYNTLWIGGPTVNEFTWAPPQMSVSLSNFTYLSSHDMHNAVYPYLMAHSVRYVVLSNQDIQGTSPNPFESYGFANYSDAYAFFNASNLTQVYSRNSVIVFEIPSINGPVYYPDLLLNTYNHGDGQSALYGLFSSLGYNISLASGGIPTGFDDITRTIDIVTPSEASQSGFMVPQSSGSNTTSGPIQAFYYKNSTSFSGAQNYFQNNSSSIFVHYLPGNFTTTSWGGNTSFNYSNGRLSAYGKKSSFSEGFNGALSERPDGIHVLTGTSPILLSVSFEISTSVNFTGSIRLYLIGEQYNYREYTTLDQYGIVPNNNTSVLHFSTVLPSNTSYFGFRLGGYSFTGGLNIGFINLTYSPYISPDGNAPFGNYLSLNNSSFSVPYGYGETDLFCIPFGSTGSASSIVSVSPGESKVINGYFEGAIAVRNFSLKSVVGLYAVVNQPVVKADVIRDSGRILTAYLSGYDGSYIYNVTSKDIVISLKSTSEVDAAYAALVTFAFVLILFCFPPLMSCLSIPVRLVRKRLIKIRDTGKGLRHKS
ncbi:MAG: hypothetical protein M1151_07755 [Candidatus Thermoplasmatota archaeon]|nr:hypothetical protein [Candidatus Thermoplasmatota archaeon]